MSSIHTETSSTVGLHSSNDSSNFDEEIAISDQNVAAVLRQCVSVKKKTETLIRRCVNHLSANNGTVISNIFETFLYVCENEMVDLMEPLSECIMKQIDRYSCDEKFLNASHLTLASLISHRSSECKNEDALVRALIRWETHNWNERKDYFNELLKNIPATKLSPNLIAVLKCFGKDQDPRQSPTNESAKEMKVDLSQTFKNESSNEIEVNLCQSPANESANEMEELLVFVKYPGEQVTRIFTNRNETYSYLDALQYKSNYMQNVAIENKLYRLASYSTGRSLKFSVCDLNQLGKELYLVSPPEKTNYFDMCMGGVGNLYVYTVSESKILNYNIELNKWFKISTITDLMNGYMTAMDNKLYVFGQDKDEVIAARAYDVRVKRWEQLPKPSINYITNCCAHLGKIYIGGYTEQRVQFYDTTAGKWQIPVIDWPTHERSSYAPSKFVSYKGKLWIIAACHYYDDMSIDVYYDSRLSKWYSSSTLSDAIKRFKPKCEEDVDELSVSVEDALVVTKA